MPPATLTASAVDKSFGGHVVLDSVSVVVAPGDRIGIVAPNGAGKTTLLRILAGLERADSGSVRRSPPDASVGLLSQELTRSPGETGRIHLARVTGVASANATLDLAAAALADAQPGSDDRYALALERYLSLGAADFDTRLTTVAEDVGLSSAILDLATASLSGGQAARLSLAGVLLSRYDVLLLDEPTNDLDFEGLARLERFLGETGTGVVVVSHDRAFLERTVATVVEIDDHTHRSARFEGGWLAYQEERATSRRHAQEQYASYEAARDTLASRAQREREWASQGMKKARSADEPDKFVRHFKKNQTEQLAARARRTERMLDRLDVVDKPWQGWELRLELSSAKRSGDVVVRLADATAARGSFRLGPVGLEVGFGDRIAIVGVNGSGKSTLLAALTGAVPLTSGTRTIGPSVVFGEIDQARAQFRADATLARAFGRASGFDSAPARALLAKFGLGADHVSRGVDSLSPGERTRAALALLMATGTNCLVLDEPTNHLDLPAIEQLEQALDTWSGTLLVVTHDRTFLDALRIDRTVDVVAGQVTERR